LRHNVTSRSENLMAAGFGTFWWPLLSACHLPKFKVPLGHRQVSVQWVLFIIFNMIGESIWTSWIKSQNKFECLFTRIPYSHQTSELSTLTTCIQPGEAGQIPNAYRGLHTLSETKWI
jgi:hypothetical protein